MSTPIKSLRQMQEEQRAAGIIPPRTDVYDGESTLLDSFRPVTDAASSQASPTSPSLNLGLKCSVQSAGGFCKLLGTGPAFLREEGQPVHHDFSANLKKLA